MQAPIGDIEIAESRDSGTPGVRCCSRAIHGRGGFADRQPAPNTMTQPVTGSTPIDTRGRCPSGRWATFRPSQPLVQEDVATAR